MQQTCLSFLIAAIVACATEPRVAAKPSLHGSLATFVDPKPASLAHCTPSNRTYASPFWRAPYLECRDSLSDGSQLIELDSDTVVTELTRVWDIPGGTLQQSVWDREAGRLIAAFGPPRRAVNVPSNGAPAKLALAHWQTHCAVWRGADSVTAALRLSPTTDVTSAMAGSGWRLVRSVRNGPLSDAVDCGLSGSSP